MLLAAGIGGAAGALGAPGVGRFMGKVASRAGSGLSKVASKVAGAVRRGCSFSAETLVATPDGGQQAIASVQEGDQVEAYDPETGERSAQTVEHVWINHDDDLIDLTLRSDADSQALAHPADMSTKQQEAEVASHGLRAPPLAADKAASAASTAESLEPLEPLEPLETIHTTSEHPWLTADRGWVAAGELHVGERVRRLDGSAAIVAAVRVVPGAAIMYDLTVSQIHTFAVGAGRYVVHNTTACPLPDLSVEQIQKGLAQARTVRGMKKSAGAIVKRAGDDDILATATSGSGKGGRPGLFAARRQYENFQKAGRGNCAEFYCAGKLGEQPGQALDMFVSHRGGRGPCRACASTLQQWANANRAPIRVYGAR